MEAFVGSQWSYENIDQLNQTLIYELQSANQEMVKKIELLNYRLKMAYKERDEAKEQLQKVMNNLIPSKSTDITQIFAQPKPGSPLLIPMKANSSITESNSLSDTYNAATSPDLSSMNMADSCHIDFVEKTYVQEYNNLVVVHPKVDPADAAIDSLVNGKMLPEKGKLLQAVSEAGPLLRNLMVAGPLPRWRTPPPLPTFRIPPVSIKGYEKTNLTADQKPLMNSYPDISRGSSQMCSVSMLNFGGGSGSASGLDNGFGWPLNSGKRQRFY